MRPDENRPERHGAFACPHCGAPVPPGAAACPACGSDEQTGWADDAASAGLAGETGYADDEEFDYDAFVEREFGRGRRTLLGIPLGWVVAALLAGLVGLLVLALLPG